MAFVDMIRVLSHLILKSLGSVLKTKKHRKEGRIQMIEMIHINPPITAILCVVLTFCFETTVCLFILPTEANTGRKCTAFLLA